MGIQRHLPAVVRDPVLGTLQRTSDGFWWSALVNVGGRKVEFRIRGIHQPHGPVLLHAHDLMATWPSFYRTLQEFVMRESRRWPPLQQEVLGLQLRTIELCARRPGDGVLYFTSSRSYRTWSCDYADGQPVRMRFASRCMPVMHAEQPQ